MIDYNGGSYRFHSCFTCTRKRMQRCWIHLRDCYSTGSCDTLSIIRSGSQFFRRLDTAPLIFFSILSHLTRSLFCFFFFDDGPSMESAPDPLTDPSVSPPAMSPPVGPEFSCSPATASSPDSSTSGLENGLPTDRGSYLGALPNAVGSWRKGSFPLTERD